MPNGIYEEQSTPPIYDEQSVPAIAESVAANRAVVDSIVARDRRPMDDRIAEQQNANVLDEAVRTVSELVESDRIAYSGELDTEGLSNEDKAIRALYLLQKQDINKATARSVALIAALQSGAYDAPIGDFNELYNKTSSGDILGMRDAYAAEQHNRLRREYKDLQGVIQADSKLESVGDFVVGELVPFFSVGSRLGLSKKLLSTIDPSVDINGRGWFTGEVRQEIRERLTSMPPEERIEAVRGMVHEIERLEKDPHYGPFLTDYNIRETLEQLMTPELVSESGSSNRFDRWIGNLEIGLGGIFTVFALGKWGLPGMRKAINPLRSVPAVETAHHTANKQLISDFGQALLDANVAQKFNTTPEEVAVQFLAKPQAFVDDISVLAPDIKDVYEELNRVSNEILRSTSDLTGQALTTEQKVSVLRRDIDRWDKADQMTPIPSMSTLEYLNGDVGYRYTATIGKNANEGFDSLEEVSTHLLEMADDVDVEIWRKNEDGRMVPVVATPQELADAAKGGTLPLDDEYIYAGIRVSDLSDDDLIRISSTETDPDILASVNRESRNRAGTNPLDEEYFIRINQERYWRPDDKEFFGGETFRSGGWLPRSLLDWKAKFGREVYGTFNRLYATEQNIVANFESMLAPFYKLKDSDKSAVAAMFEWSEDFGKRNGKAPTITDLREKYPSIEGSQLAGYMALRQSHDTMYSLLNRRLYRDYKSQGYQTARPRDLGRPSYHGKRLSSADAVGGAFDPVTQQITTLSRADVDELYANGGVVIKLDLKVDVPDGGKADHILINGDDYRVGELSEMPLKYHPGYSVRFYNDPYFIVKETTGAKVNGKTTTDVVTEAVRTAPTRLSAENFLKRGNNAPDPKTGGWSNGTRANVSYKVVRARDLDQTESVFLQKQVIHQEGRMFWDERNFNRLPDVSGNPAMLDDPVESLERSVAMLSRQVSMEDSILSIKNAFMNQFGHLPELKTADAALKDMKTVVSDLKTGRRNNASKELGKVYDEAIEMAQYLRLIQGSADDFIPALRRGIIEMGYYVERLTGSSKLGKGIEKWAEMSDPMRFARAVAFNLFIVFRPARQLLLQSAQVGLIAGMDPLYVVGGQLFRDSYALRAGLYRLRRSSYDDGFSVTKWAKIMGLSTKEYRILAKEFNRTGFLDVVDLHSFTGGARPFNKNKIGTSSVRKAGQAIRDSAQNVGFNTGERNNMTFSYLMALRQIQKQNGKSLSQFTRTDWDMVAEKGSDLSLGMTRMNQFAYQRGALSVATQFLSFTHKAALTLLGQNPAVKGTNLAKVLMGSYVLYGANMFGGRDWVEEQLRTMGLGHMANERVSGDSTIIDILAGGVIETGFNALGRAALGEDDWQDLDFGSFAPGVDITRLRETGLEAAMNSPLTTFLGPSGTLGGRFIESFDWVAKYMNGPNQFDDPAKQAAIVLDQLAKGMGPAYSDVTLARLARKTGYWVNQAGDPLPLRSSLNAVLARGLFGIRTLEEAIYYEFKNEAWESESEMRSIAKANREFFEQLWRKREADGGMTVQDYSNALYVMSGWMDDWPEGKRQRVLEDSLTENFDDSNRKTMLQLMAEDPLMYDTSNQVLLQRMIEKDPRLSAQQAEEFMWLMDDIFQSRVRGDEMIQEDLNEELENAR